MDIMIIVNLIAGAIAGLLVSRSSRTFDMGTVGNNLVAGCVGGFVMGQVVYAFLPSFSGAIQAGEMGAGQLVPSVIAGLVGGAILPMIIGVARRKAA